MTSEKVIKLSVEETNGLRDKLGHKCLRVELNNENTSKELSPSIGESNELRSKFG